MSFCVSLLASHAFHIPVIEAMLFGECSKTVTRYDPK